jgi:hypothetical protein
MINAAPVLTCLTLIYLIGYFCQSIFLYLSDAQFLLDQRLRKVVPVMYQKCQLPPELTYYYWLNYARSGKLYDFWTKLHTSIQSASSTQPARYLKHYKWSDQHITANFCSVHSLCSFSADTNLLLMN